jgi:short-subunit dehydrogenase
MVLLITGIAEHSLGESLVRHAARHHKFTKIICVDLYRNSSLEREVEYVPIQFNLNPLQHQGGSKGFSNELKKALNTALTQLGEEGFTCLIQSAGVYWAGALLDSTPQIRANLYGVNFLGRVEVLYTAMQINAERGLNNSASLTSVDVGSFQGLSTRAARSIYASSKAAGIDFAASLAVGAEVRRSLYFAPGPIDTLMLHRNHWVVKAQGPEALFNDIKSADRDLYRAIFVDCSEEVFRKMIEGRSNSLELLEYFQAYKAHRQVTALSELGILNPEECSDLLWTLVSEPERSFSGVYLVGHPPKGDISVEYAEFDKVDRYHIVRSSKI